MTIYLECYTILYTVPCLPPCSYSYFKGGYCYYNLIIFLMMQTYLFVIMILLFRVIIIPLCITVSWVAYCVHDLRVGILVIYISCCIFTFLLTHPCFIFHIYSSCLNPIVTYCLHVYTFKGGYSCHFYLFHCVYFIVLWLVLIIF